MKNIPPLSTAILALGLVFAGAAGAQDSKPEMKLKLPDGHTVLIDADRLGPAPHYPKTVAFVFQFDPHSARSAAEIRQALDNLGNNTALNPALKAKMKADLENLAALHAAAREKPGSTNAADIKPFMDHLAHHNVTEARIEAVRQTCIQIILARPVPATGGTTNVPMPRAP